MVRLKVAVPTLAVAVALYVPAVPFAVTVDEVALPSEPVVVEHALAVDPELLQVLALALYVALAPLPGTVNVTDTPETGLPYASFTIATSGLAKAVLTVADWPEPD